MEIVDDKLKKIAFKLRKIRELKGLTRDKFCEPLNENSEYWGLIERGEQAISLPKLLLVCQIYGLPIEKIVDLPNAVCDNSDRKKEIQELLEKCDSQQLDIIKKFIEAIVLAL